MSYQVPQKEYFESAEKYSRYKNRSEIVVIALSLFSVIIESLGVLDKYYSILIIITVILAMLSFFFSFKFTEEYIHAEKIRRDGLVDDAFSTRMAKEVSDGYYDNDEVDIGLKRMLINVFENSFFSTKVVPV